MSTHDLEAPSITDWQQWTAMCILHVVGYTRRASDLYRANPWGMKRVATLMRRLRPVDPRPLYRGLLLELPRNRRPFAYYENGPPILSFSEDIATAMWFSDPGSAVAGSTGRRSGIAGYLATYKRVPLEATVLFHYSWDEAMVPDAPVSLAVAAAMHPRVDEAEFVWNIRTRKDVLVTAPASGRFAVQALEQLPRPTTSELDDLLLYPAIPRTDHHQSS